MTVAAAHSDSAEGVAALLHAAREARFLGVPLAVLHVLGDEDSAQLEGLRQQISDTLGAAGLGGLDWTLHTAAEESTRAAALVELTEQVAASLLVVGSRRRTPIGKFLLGSTVQRVVLDSPVAVLVVKGEPEGGRS